MANNYIDIYCERESGLFWAEPVNALTNLFFLVSALFLFMMLRQNYGPRFPYDLGILSVLVALIGIGSFLFHTFASHWALLADVIPIMIFQLTFIYVYSRRYIGLGRMKSLIPVLTFIIVVILFSFLPGDLLNGSIGYLPAFLALCCICIYHWKKDFDGLGLLVGAAILFALSLTFRSIDGIICDSITVGTHFFWHVLNSIVLFLSVRSLMFSPKIRQKAG